MQRYADLFKNENIKVTVAKAAANQRLARPIAA